MSRRSLLLPYRCVRGLSSVIDHFERRRRWDVRPRPQAEGESGEIQDPCPEERRAHGAHRRAPVEERREHRHAEGRPDLAARVQHARADAGERGWNAGEDGRVHRGRDEAGSDADEDERQRDDPEGRYLRQSGEDEGAGGEQREADEDRATGAVSSSEPPAGDARETERDGDRGRVQAGVERGIPAQALEVHREYEDAAEEAAGVEERRGRRRGEGPVGEKLQGQGGAPPPGPGENEAGGGGPPGGKGKGDPRAGPPQGGPAEEGPA